MLFSLLRKSRVGNSEKSEKCKKKKPLARLFFLVAGMGFEPHDLRVMSPTSYQTALPRDIRYRDAPMETQETKDGMVPVTGVEPVRDVNLTGF